MYYLDTRKSIEKFRQVLHRKIYVDKSMLIDKLNEYIGSDDCYFCITRPRRFGKTINANMLGAYYTQGYDSHELFENLKIAQVSSYHQHLNKHHVVYIDFSRLPDPCTTFNEYMDWVKFCLQDDLKKAYGIEKLTWEPIQNLFEKTNDKFIFIMDEWDSIFYKDFMRQEDKDAYLEFLKGLLKDQPYVELAYMTGVLPIAKYSSGSELNVFREYSFINDGVYEDFFGFDEQEVRALTQEFTSVSFDMLKKWYDGYYKSDGSSLFNPRSVSSALTDGICRNYWTETGPMNEIADCIEHNVDAVREDVVKLVSGIPVRIRLKGYSAVELQLNSRDEILSAMVVYGFLSYYNGQLYIPNHELMEKFQDVLERKSMGKVAEVVQQSEAILQATLTLKADRVAEYLETIHDREIPFLQYNDENSLSCVITLCYLRARDYYDVIREAKSGKGFVDYLFIPKVEGYPAMVLELKYGKSAQQAIKQIKEKRYMDCIRNYSKILLVGINYDPNTKQHDCVIEAIASDSLANDMQ